MRDIWITRAVVALLAVAAAVMFVLYSFKNLGILSAAKLLALVLIIIFAGSVILNFVANKLYKIKDNSDDE